jgi:hypothetical protein
LKGDVVTDGPVVVERLRWNRPDVFDRVDGPDTPGSGNGFRSAVEKKIGRFARPAESLARKSGWDGDAGWREGGRPAIHRVY